MFFSSTGGIYPSYDTLNGASDIPIGSMYAIYGNIYHQYTPNVTMGYEMKQFEKNYDKTEQGNIWCSKCSKIPICQMTVGNWGSSCQRRPVWPFLFFFPGNHGEAHPKREKYGIRVEKMVMATMIGVWGCPKIKKSGTPKTVAVQKMRLTVSRLNLRLNWHLSTRSTPFQWSIIDVKIGGVPQIIPNPIGFHWFPLVNHHFPIIFPSGYPRKLPAFSGWGMENAPFWKISFSVEGAFEGRFHTAGWLIYVDFMGDPKISENQMDNLGVALF